MSAVQHATPDFLGHLTFQSPQVKRSLSSTGDVYATIDPDTGGFSEFVGTDNVTIPTAIYNGRLTAPDHLTLDTAGFQLIDHTLPPTIDYYNEQQVLTAYYDEVCRVVQAATGAHRVYAFDHVVRQTGVGLNYAVKDGVKLGGAATIVHGDYAMRGAPVRRDHFTLPPKQLDTFRATHGSRPLIPPTEFEQLKGRRFAVVNLWRSIDPVHPVVDMPLTMCDCRTVSAEDYVAIQFRYTDRTYDTYVGGHSPQQRWYYFPEMSANEAVLLKTYDSQGVLWRDEVGYSDVYKGSEAAVQCSSTLHSAVRDTRLGEGTDYAKRQSIEVRTIVFY